METFNVHNIWQVGTRVFFRDEFVQLHEFEREAYEFFSREMNDPLLGLTPDAFCKRINHVYTQKLEALENLMDLLKLSGEFSEVSLRPQPSVIGLPFTLSYLHPSSGVRTEFDGVIFVSEKLIKPGDLPLLDAKTYVEKKGYDFSMDDISQTGSAKAKKLWEKLAMNSSAHVTWRYVTERADLPSNTFNPQLHSEQVVLSLSLVDPRFIQYTSPTGELSSGQEFEFLIGFKSHIRQIIAHESESYRYLHILETKIRKIRDDALKKKDRFLLNKSPLAPWGVAEILSFRKWHSVIKYWAQIHRDLETLIRHKSYLTSFKPIFVAFSGFAENGVAFYNLGSPFIKVDNGEAPRQELAQYPTPAPNSIKIEGNNLKISGYKPEACSFGKYSKRLINFLETVKHIVDDTFDLMKSISSTPSLQVALLAAMVSLVALIIGLASIAVSVLIAVL